ncbi:mitochondrial import inner membrane translocase TIM40 [Parastagonospora nodorum]|nr:mitochondrial import inner membrane translocase TIM40 [Parastagonospora nodorum]KAH4070597.1 mitochondrial import inner membrane translocase TIM40 [Parastagonospora nodorum]KAH4093135.1 mitochondrial import inner membrane translocase TIM40 [Parastagonospora nodorum]KAH4097485.1 mitochondrial import inner membrane translocase TIM40 [Parastagonospora nodorum]KAH4171261.1 mitochondrial import inner membrane translocase TIM40 [Parastagonospora nodorum]
MYRAAPRLIARSALPRTIAPTRRFISTAPPTQKSRSWKSLVARFGIAGTIIYYYNNTDVFAEEPQHPVQALPETETESEHLPTIESIAAEREKRKAVQAQLDAQAQAQKEAQSTQQDGGEGGMQGLEGEADQQGAFNPETGEINWDCPCLGGMATGPCGEQFKAAFSCFVYSEEEPKGMDCIDKFKDMQNCFREYPEVYGSELEGDEDEGEDLPAPGQPQPQPQSESTPTAAYSDSTPAPSSKPRETGASEKAKLSGEPDSKPSSTTAAKSTVSSGSDSKPAETKNNLGLVPDNYKPDAKEEPVSESEELVPKAAHDGR